MMGPGPPEPPFPPWVAPEAVLELFPPPPPPPDPRSGIAPLGTFTVADAPFPPLKPEELLAPETPPLIVVPNGLEMNIGVEFDGSKYSDPTP